MNDTDLGSISKLFHGCLDLELLRKDILNEVTGLLIGFSTCLGLWQVCSNVIR